MLKRVLSLFLLLQSISYGDSEYSVENTNITLSTDKTSTIYNYDRLRFGASYKSESFFTAFIGDVVNYYGRSFVNSDSFSYLKAIKSDTPIKTQTTFEKYNSGALYGKIYRLYGGYEDDKNRVLLGLQNISMGVGRIWTPTNLFNPKNSYALEPDEVFGVAALSYTRHIDDTSHLTLVASQSSDESFKYAARYKAFLDFADFALDVISSDYTKMIGYEVEGNLYESGVELRSEGAYIKQSFETDSDIQEKEFFQAIAGADYGFVNGITLVAEALYSSKSFSYDEIADNYDSVIAPNLVYSNAYAALSLSYGFNIFLAGSLTYIESFNEKNSRFISPSLTYSFSDYSSLVFGAMIQNGAADSEFGGLDNTYYFKYGVSF